MGMTALITGITGTLGSVAAKKILAWGWNVIGYSRDEMKQAAFPKHQNQTLYLGDVRDQGRLVEASRGVDVIFHFAALKHVDKLEDNPEEAIQTNIVGTQNVLHAQRVNKIRRVVLTSTDKAVYPINVYGRSKGIAEALVLRNPVNTVCRYGNVLASRGSVVGCLVKTLRENNEVLLTDPNMTRFWITQDEAADFVITAGPGLRIPTMKAAPLHRLAQCVADVMGISSYQLRQIPVRAGEKTHECLRTAYEGEEMHSNSVAQFTSAELTEILRPIVRGLL